MEREWDVFAQVEEVTHVAQIMNEGLPFTQVGTEFLRTPEWKFRDLEFHHGYWPEYDYVGILKAFGVKPPERLLKNYRRKEVLSRLGWD
jgi:hypothetical protein